MTQQVMDTEGDEYEPAEYPAGYSEASPMLSWVELKRAYDALLAERDILLEKNKKLRFRLQTIEGIARDDDYE